VLNDLIVHDVIIEVTLCQPPNQIVQLGLWVRRQPRRRERLVVPVVSNYKAVEVKWLARHCSVDYSLSFDAGLKRLAASAAFDFILLTAPRKIVLVGIQGKKNAQVPFGVDLENQQVTVVLDLDLNLGTFTGKEPLIVADPQLNRRRLAQSGGFNANRVGCKQQRKEQRGIHGAPEIPDGDNFTTG
jgi:hypothetical protein